MANKKTKTIDIETKVETTTFTKKEIPDVEEPDVINPEVINVPMERLSSEEAINKLLAKVEELERKDTENEKKLKMLYDVADKGRVAHFENAEVARAGKKPIKVKLSKFQDKIIVGWRNAKDIPIYHPVTGLQTGEEQQMEVNLYDHEGRTSKYMFNSYKAFSDAKYIDRFEVDVVSKSENWEGKIMYTVKLPNGRDLEIDVAFVN